MKHVCNAQVKESDDNGILDLRLSRVVFGEVLVVTVL